MSWELYLPIARHSANVIMLLGMGGSVGFISGMFGVGGGFLMTPMLIMAGIPPVVAAASDSNQIVAAATSGAYAHHRMGNVDLKMGCILLLGNWGGGTLGVEIIKILKASGGADLLIKSTYVVLLAIVGTLMLVESLRSIRRSASQANEVEPASGTPLYLRLGQAMPWPMHFEKSDVTISPMLPFLVGAFVGMIGSIMGLGGGFIMVPLMYYLLRMPMYLVVGTNLFQEAFLCANVTVLQAVANHAVDLVLAVSLLVGSSLGAQVGARASRRLHADQLRLLLAVIILLVMAKIMLGLILPPRFMLDVKGVH